MMESRFCQNDRFGPCVAIPFLVVAQADDYATGECSRQVDDVVRIRTGERGADAV